MGSRKSFYDITRYGNTQRSHTSLGGGFGTTAVPIGSKPITDPTNADIVGAPSKTSQDRYKYAGTFKYSQPTPDKKETTPSVKKKKKTSTSSTGRGGFQGRGQMPADQLRD